MHWRSQVDLNIDNQFTILIHENIRPDLWWQFKCRCTGTAKVKTICFDSIFRWLFRGLGSTYENVQQLKDNVDILMSSQNLQQQQIKEIFKLTNLTRIEASQNRKVMRQLDLKLIQLNHNLHTLEFCISRLQVDRNFVIFILQIHICTTNLQPPIHVTCGNNSIK